MRRIAEIEAVARRHIRLSTVQTALRICPKKKFGTKKAGKIPTVVSCFNWEVNMVKT